jgi:aspartyl-tRNA(Asn)/glutamyl-tRNA(Gln) amidotransferase subunit A
LSAPPDDLWKLSAADLGRAYRAGICTPEDALDAILARIAAHNPRLNAIVTLDEPGARIAARASAARIARGVPLGPLDGVPLTVKDNIAVAGLTATWGSRLFAKFVPEVDELPIARLRAAGAVILGKTNTPEFAMQGHTDNLLFGVTRNPWDDSRSAGGSSGGAVAAVAAGFGPLAIGTDGGGSIRRPSSHNGLVGFKPSLGRVPRADGLPAIFLDYEVVGPMARTVEDAVLAMQVLCPPHPRDAASRAFTHLPFAVPAQAPRCRILHISTFGDAPVDPEITLRMQEAVQALRALGHGVDSAPHFDIVDAVNARWMSLSQAGLAHMLEAHAGWRELLTAAAIANADAGRALPATALFDLLRLVDQMKSRLDVLFTDYDLLLTPAAAALPWPIDQTHPAHIAGRAVGPRGHAVFTGFVNAAGLPAIALPCAPSAAGLPNGLQLVGRWGADGALCAVAQAYEAARPWRDAWPVI